MRFIMGVEINGRFVYTETEISDIEFKREASDFLERIGAPALSHLHFLVEEQGFVDFRKPDI